ncbi:MAG: response regulator [Candidatus Magnetomorum sp.]|nr:response regulator [Candidatus Magnetomorum sp.]
MSTNPENEKWSTSFEKEKLRVLIVEDELISRTILREMVKRFGGIVYEAENGKEALNLMEHTIVDIILMDLCMPVMDGFEASRKIKKRAGDTFLPIISINAFDDDATLTKALACGADDFLAKPVSTAILISKINTMMRIKKIYEEEHEQKIELIQTKDLLEKTNKRLSVANQELQQYQNDLEKRVQRQTHKLRKKDIQLLEMDRMVSIGTLSAGMAHEINNPMGFIKASIGTLRKQFKQMSDLNEKLAGSEDEKHTGQSIQSRAQKGFERVSRGVDRVIDIVSSLKRFSNIDMENIRSLNINNNIRDTINILKSEINLGKIYIQTQLQKLPAVICSPIEINLCLYNVIKNAIDAVNQTGEIQIITTHQPAEKTICIKIMDNGCGMSEADIKRAFTPFFTTKPVGQGTGMGLTIAEKVARNHRGCIELSSKKGEGTIVTIVLSQLGHITAPMFKPEKA